MTWVHKLIVKFCTVALTIFCGLVVWALFQIGAYSVASIVFVLWLFYVGVVTYLENPENLVH